MTIAFAPPLVLNTPPPQLGEWVDPFELDLSPAFRKILEEVLSRLALVVSYDSAAILLPDEQGWLQVVAMHRLDKSELRHEHEPFERRTLAHSVLNAGRPLVVADVQEHPAWRRTPSSSRIHAWMGAPLFVEGRNVGVINVDGCCPGAYTDHDLQILLGFAFQVAAMLENAWLEYKLHQMHRETILALVQAVETRDPFTAGHSRRVAHYAVTLGQLLGLAEPELATLHEGGLLHDVGKISVSDTILLKPGHLSLAEKALIRSHPIRGCEIIGQINEFQHLRPLILWHHERYDGQGYPDRLWQAGIPPLARILSIADGFDAMTSARAYRPALPLKRVIEIFRADRGQQWDPHGVEALLDWI